MTVAVLTSRALIALRGAEWRSFLQGLITQDVETLQPGELRYGALLTPQGRLMHDLFILGEDDGALLDVAAETREALIAKLKLYRLRAKVEIQPVDGAILAAWRAKPDGKGWIIDPRLFDLGWRKLGGGEGAAAEPEAVYDAHRLALGVPDPAKEGRESDYPIELNLDLLNGIDFKKGCFVGQETTSRMHRRGKVRTRMAPIAFEGPAPAIGVDVTAGALRAGELRSVADGRALAFLRMDRAIDMALTLDNRSATLELPTWLARSFQQPDNEPPQS